MAPKLKITFLLAALVAVLLLYMWTPPSSSQAAFTWVYREVLVDEVLLLLLVTTLLVPLVNRRFDSFLRHEVRLAWPVRALALLASVLGFLLFAFWATVDILGGYGGPGYTFSTYPFIVTIYKDIGLNHIAFRNQQGVMGFSSFCVSMLGFMILRARRGIRAAVRDGVTRLAAPVILVFELALWNYVPLDMYWHAITFAPWSVGRYPTAGFYGFVWAGNVYLLSNWLVLIASFLLILISVFYHPKAPEGRSYYQSRPRREDWGKS
jgi:hypothetical protein